MMSTLEKYNGVFPERLRKLLDDRGVTRTELARELNISRQAVSQYADGTGQPNIDKLKTIALFFSVSSDYLIGLSDYERIETKELTAEDMGIFQKTSKIFKEFPAPSSVCWQNLHNLAILLLLHRITFKQ